MMWLRFLLSIILLATGFTAGAQFTYVDSVYNTSNYNWDVTYNSLKLSDDSFLLIGYSTDSDYFLNFFSISPSGQLQTNNQQNVDAIKSIYIAYPSFDKDSNIIIPGQYYNPIVHGEVAKLVKTNRQGNIIWIKTYGISRYSEWQGLYALHVLATNDNHYLLICQVGIDSINSLFLVIKTDTDGNELSRWQYGSPYYQAPLGGGIQTTDGGFLFVGGSSENDSILHEYGFSSIYMVKTDSTGNQSWTAAVPEGYDQYGDLLDVANGYSVIEDTDGYILCGNMPWKSNAAQYNMGIGPRAWEKCWVGKVSKLDGSLIWQKLYGLDTLDVGVFYKITPTADGNYVLCGVTAWNNYYNNAACVYKIDHNGDSIWSTQFVYHDSSDISVNPYSINTIGTSGYMVTGYVLLDDNQTPWPWVVTLDSNGCVISNCLSASGIAKNEISENIQIFPNPAHNLLQLIVQTESSTEKISLQIYDLSGRLVKSDNAIIPNQAYAIDINSFADGIYFAEIFKGNIVMGRKKFVKQ